MKPYYVLALEGEGGFYALDSVDVGKNNRFETKQGAAHARQKLYLRGDGDGVVIAKIQIMKEGK